MSQWENADGWEDAGWEDATEEDFLTKLKTGAKQSFAEVGNTVDRAFTGAALGLQHAVQGPNEEGDKLYRELQERLKSRSDWAGSGSPGVAGATGGALATLPMQLMTFPLSPFSTGQKSIEAGEDLKTAQQNAGIDAAGNAAAVLLPGSVGAKKAAQVASGAGINALQTYVTGHLIADNSKTADAKKMFTPTWEQIAQAALIGGALGPMVGAKAKESPAPDVRSKLDALDASKKAAVPPVERIPEQMELPLMNDVQQIAEMRGREGAQRDLFGPANQDIRGRMDATTPFPERELPGIETTRQGELFDQPESGRVANPYEAKLGDWRIDENGIPVKVDLSMEAANLENPLQRNLWGDELQHTRNPVGQNANLFDENGQQEGIPLTQAIDSMPWINKRAAINRELKGDVPVTPEMEAAMAAANRADPNTSRSPSMLPGKMRGAIDPEALTEGFQKLFHGGKEFTEWNPKKIGSGEGMGALGPGLYTSDNPKLAAIYKKYGDDVHFDNDGNMVVKPGVLNELAVDTRKILDYRAKSDKWEAAIKNLDALGYKASSRGIQGALQEAHKWRDEANARKAMTDAGIDGMYVQLGGTMGKEIVIFNPSIIRQISRTDTPVVKLPKSQRGGVDFKAVTDSFNNAVEKIGSKFKLPATKEDTISKMPGMKKSGADLIYVPEPGVLLAEKIKGEADGPPLFTSLQSGLQHASEKSNSTLMKGTAQWLEYARRMADYGIRTVVQPLEKTFTKMKTDDMIALMEVNKREMFNRQQYTPEELKSVGLSDKQIQAYAQFRKAQDEVLAVQNKGRAALGKEPITPQNAYLSSVFHGDYHLAVKDKNGNLVWYIQQPTKKQANAAMAWLKENAKDLNLADTKVEYKPRPFANVPRDVMGAYQDALKMFPEDDPVAMRIRSIMEEYAQQKGNSFLGQNLHHVDKKANVRGFMGDQPWLTDKENAYNLAHAQIEYMKDAYRWSHMQEALTQITPIISDPEIVKNQPNNMAVTKGYVLNNMGLSKNMFKAFENYLGDKFGRSSSLVPGVVRDLKGLAYMVQLGASVGYMIATPLQLIPGLAGWHTDLGLSMKNFYRDLPLTLSDGIIGMYHDIGKDSTGGRWDSTGGMTPFGQKAYRWAEANGVFTANLFDENEGLGAHKVMAEGQNILGYTISKPDQMSRWIAFLSFARHLETEGKYKTQADLFQRAAELTEHVATDMHRQTRPLIVDQFGSFGEATYMYRAPQVNMLNTLSIFSRKFAQGNPGPLLMYLGAMGMMGGVLNLPGVQELDGAWNLLKEGIAKYKPEWYRHVEGMGIKEFMLSNFSDNTTTGQIVNWGAASVMTGANMATRFSQGVVDVQNPLSAFSPLAEELYHQASIGKMLMNPTQDTAAQAMRQVLPPLGKGQLETRHPSFKSGVRAEDGSWTGYRNPNDVENTDTFVKRSPKEEKYKELGLTALTEAQRRTKDFVNNEESSRVKTAQQSMMDNLFNAVMREDAKDIERYAKGYFQLHGDSDRFSAYLMQKIQRLGMTGSEFQKTHIRGLTTLNNVVRRLEMDKGNE